MSPPLPATIDLSFPLWLIPAIALVGVVTVLVWGARNLPRSTKLLTLTGCFLLALASAGPRLLSRQPPPEVAVYVDLSPSTRDATYRDPKKLDQWLADLLGGTPFRVQYFADGELTNVGVPRDRIAADIPARRTTFQPSPTAPTVVLFSDARFELPPTAPPTFVVVDPALDNPTDAAITTIDPGDSTAGKPPRFAIRNAGGPRRLDVFVPSASGQPVTAGPGSYWLVAPKDESFTPLTQVGATLAPGDAWPENDGLTADVPPPPTLERWWAGDASRLPGSGWQTWPGETDAAEPSTQLRAAAIVIDDVKLRPWTQRSLSAYVRELGGTLVLVGGQSMFAAGGYAGTPLDEISPLAATPPEPARRWAVLIDASGSMATPAAGAASGEGAPRGSRFDAATRAAARVLRSLPPADLTDVGSFARDVNWWRRGSTTAELATQLADAPPRVAPSGPTNLAAAIDATITVNGVNATTQPPRHLIVLTDGGADPLDVPAVTARLQNARVTLHVLAIGTGPALDSLASVATSTGGTVVDGGSTANWLAAAGDLARKASPSYLETAPVAVTFTGDFKSLGTGETGARWNRTWARQRATVIATAPDGTPLAAWWGVGVGRVVAFAYAAPPDVVAQVADRLVRPPRDPRLSVTWTEDATAARVAIVAKEADGSPINAATLNATIGGVTTPIPQVGPGRYELSIEPRQATAVVLHDGEVIDRRALAGHYAPEFAAIGNDYAAMRELASRTGGRVIGPNDNATIDLPRSRVAERSLTPWVAMLGATFLGTALVAWRRS